MPLQHARDAHRPGLGLVTPRNRPNVRHDDAAPAFDLVVDRVEARVVDREPLHVFVNLQTGAPAVERSREIAGRIGVVEVNRAEWNSHSA